MRMTKGKKLLFFSDIDNNGFFDIIIDNNGFFWYNIIKVKSVVRVMEKNLQQMQFKDRLCRTLLRINWLIAIVAMLPVLSKIFLGVAAIGMAFYYLILIAVIITLGLFLLNDSFRALYDVDLSGLQQLSDQIVQAYRIAQAVLAGICAFLSVIVLIVIVRNQDVVHKSRKIVSVTLAVLIVLTATLVYYMKLI